MHGARSLGCLFTPGLEVPEQTIRPALPQEFRKPHGAAEPCEDAMPRGRVGQTQAMPAFAIGRHGPAFLAVQREVAASPHGHAGDHREAMPAGPEQVRHDPLTPPGEGIGGHGIQRAHFMQVSSGGKVVPAG